MAFSTQKIFFHIPFKNETYDFECVNPCVKMKSYASSIDKRSWAASDAKKSRFLVDLVGCHTSVVVPRQTKRSRSPGKGGKGRGLSGGKAQNAEQKKNRKSPNLHGDSRPQSPVRRARSEPDSSHASSPNLIKGRGGYGGPGPGHRGQGQPGRRFSGPNQVYGNIVQRQRSFRGPFVENEVRGGRGSIAQQAWSQASRGEINEGPRHDQNDYEWPGQYGYLPAAHGQSGDQYGYGDPGQVNNYCRPGPERNYFENQEDYYSQRTDQDQGHNGNVGQGYWGNDNYGDQGPVQYQGQPEQNSYGAPNQESPEQGDRDGGGPGQYTNGYEYASDQGHDNHPDWNSDGRQINDQDEYRDRRGENYGRPEQGQGWNNYEGEGQQNQWHNDQGEQELNQNQNANGNPYQDNEQSWVDYQARNQTATNRFDSSQYHDANY